MRTLGSLDLNIKISSFLILLCKYFTYTHTCLGRLCSGRHDEISHLHVPVRYPNVKQSKQWGQCHKPLTYL